jgi:hypothetical protein
VKPSPDLTWPAATAAVNETVRWDRDERLSTRRCCETVGAGPTRSIRQLKARVLGHQAIRITGRSAHAPPRRTEPARQRATRAAGSDAIPPFPAIHGNHTRTTKHAKLVMLGISLADGGENHELNKRVRLQCATGALMFINMKRWGLGVCMAICVLSIPAGMTVRGDGHMAERQVRRPSSHASPVLRACTSNPTP